MTNKVELNELTQVVHKENAFLVALNENFRRLQQAINDTLSRTGEVPNQMEEVLDMNGKRIVNVGDAEEETDALTRRFINGLIAQVEDAIARLTDLTNQAIEAVRLFYTENIYPDMVAAVDDAQAAARDAKGYYDDTKALYDELAGLSEHLAEILAVSADIANINAVAGDLTNIDTLAGLTTELTAIYNNLTEILAASTYADNAKTWAEGADVAVEALGGTHSSKRWAEIAEQTISQAIPPQAGKAGKFLQTDGTNTSWETALVPDDIVSSVDSSSTDLKAVGAKLFYDTCGDIEALINAL